MIHTFIAGFLTGVFFVVVIFLVVTARIAEEADRL